MESRVIGTLSQCTCITRYDKHTGFKNVPMWLSDVREHADPNLTCILVGNKVDLCEPDGESRGGGGGSGGGGGVGPGLGVRQREVTSEEGEAFARENGLLFVESSAKSGQNVELAFFTASRDILDKVKRGVFDQGKVRPCVLVVPSSLFLCVSVCVCQG